jgi:hypothetical protein
VLLVLPPVLLAFVALTVALVASRTVRDTYETPFSHVFFSDTLHMKAWLITAALVLALVQLLTASRIYELLRFPPKGRFYHLVHRWSGRTLLGSFLYGVLLAKVLVVRSNGCPGWALPLGGGALFAILAALWLTSASGFSVSLASAYSLLCSPVIRTLVPSVRVRAPPRRRDPSAHQSARTDLGFESPWGSIGR